MALMDRSMPRWRKIDQAIEPLVAAQTESTKLMTTLPAGALILSMTVVQVVAARS